MTFASRPMTALALLALLSACSDGIDLDLRGGMGGRVDTTEAALNATTDRPAPDNRGVISYPSYQVAVARRGDRLADVAARVGLPAEELARFNGIRPNDPLNRGEIVALPRRVAEPSPATGAAGTGPIQPPSSVDVTTLASNAINNAPDTSRRSGGSGQVGVEPVRHKVARGETAFTIARLYKVSPRALAEWNGLDRDFRIREGQYLLIPVAQQTAAAKPREPITPAPGAGSPTPVPPSAATPLPTTTPEPRTASKPDPKPTEPVADIGQNKVKTGGSMSMPVSGPIIREYSAGSNPGIDISASPGAPVSAAASGSVISVSKKTDGASFVIVRHPDNVNTVYLNVADINVNVGDSVSRGQQIGRVAPGEVGFLHFEVRKGLDSADPMQYLQ